MPVVTGVIRPNRRLRSARIPYAIRRPRSCSDWARRTDPTLRAERAICAVLLPLALYPWRLGFVPPVCDRLMHRQAVNLDDIPDRLARPAAMKVTPQVARMEESTVSFYQHIDMSV